MLSQNEWLSLEENYALHFTRQSIKPIAGGDVNQAYQVASGATHYLIKKINLRTYAKEYRANPEEIRCSLRFIEAVCRQYLPDGHVIPAISGHHGPIFEVNHVVYLLYPYVEGRIIENQALSLDQVGKIARQLKQIHQQTIHYDAVFSQNKYHRYVNVGLALAHHPFWGRFKTSLTRAPGLVRLKKAVRFMAEHCIEFDTSVRTMAMNPVCHNDLKPKNVLWGKDGQYWIIDWEAACDFDHQADYLDTLLAWVIEDHEGKLRINSNKVYAFQQQYFINPDGLQAAVYVVLLKWYFWWYFCLAKLVKHPLKIPHYWHHAQLALKYINLIIDHRDLAFLKTRGKDQV